MRNIKFGILICLLTTFVVVNGQERVASFNWLDRSVITSSESSNSTLQFLSDKNDTTFYVVNSSAPSWIKIEVPDTLIMSAYTIVSSYDQSMDPKKWTLEWSQDGIVWTEVHTMEKTFDAPNFPLNITTGVSGGGDGHNYFRITFDNEGSPWAIAELQIFGCRKHFEANVTGNGGAITGEYQGLPAYGETIDMLINNTYKKFCQTGTKSFWAEYESPEPILLEKYSLTTAYNSTRVPRTWELLGSNDGVNYYQLDIQKNKNFFQAPYATSYYEVGGDQTTSLDWERCAELTYKALVDEYWRNFSKGGKYFIQTNSETPHMGFNYWWNAHALDVLVDGYQRTGDPAYITKMNELHQAISVNFYHSGTGTPYWHPYFDDMEWMALASIRAYEATGLTRYKTLAIRLWDWIKDGWTDTKFGGIMWEINSPNSKNACSNAPAIIIAARLYKMTGEEEYLTWAKRIYNWTGQHLVDNTVGYVWDGYGNYNVGNVYTYNIGTWVGGCLELYLITGEEVYLNRAIKSANLVVNDIKKFSPYGILYNGENSGDGGLFKGIFMRYLSQMILHGGLKDEVKNNYINYFRDNGIAVWNSSTLKPQMIVSKKWHEMPDSPAQDCSVQLSGVMLFELLAELERNGMMPDKNEVIAQNSQNTYKYFRLNMMVNNGASDSELSEWQLFGTEQGAGIEDGPVVLTSAVKIIGGHNQILLISQGNVSAFNYQIFDVFGRTYSSGQSSSDISVPVVSSGAYVVRVTVGSKIFSQKVLVK